MLTRWLAAFCLLRVPGCTGSCRRRVQDAVDLGRPRRMARGARSAPHRDQHPAGDRLPIYVRRPAARAGMGSALDARAGATERHHRQPIFAGIGRSPVPVLLPFDTAGYLEAGANGAPTACRCRATRPISAAQICFTPVRPATTRCFRCEPGAGDGMPRGPSPGRSKCRSPARSSSTTSPIRSAARASRSRRWRRNSPTCAASSAKAMCATPSRASACPMWCRSSASTRRRGARRLACREAYPIAERFLKALAHRRRPTGAAAPRHFVRDRRTADGGFARFHLSPERRHHRPQRRAQARRPRRSRRLFANPVSAGESPGRRPLAIASAGANSERAAASIRGGTIFAKPRSFQVGQCAAGFGHQGQDIRPAPCPPNSEQRSSCHPRQAGRRRGSRRHPDPLTEAAGGDAADQHPQRAHPLSLHAHEPVQPWMRTASSTAAGSPRAKRSAWSRTISISRTAPRYHLHFDVQVFTRDGWLWVNPYTTLISAYERLIRGRGREIGTDPPGCRRRGARFAGGHLRRSPAEGREN